MDVTIRGVDGPLNFSRFWVASTVSEFDTYVTTVTLPVLVVQDLGGSTTGVGLINATH